MNNLLRITLLGINISEDIREYLKNKDLLNPTFEIFMGKDIEQKITELGLEEDFIKLTDGQVRMNEILLIFNLPKPLARYWWKASEHPKILSGKTVDREKKGPIPRGTAISWGDFYESLMPVGWEAVGYFESEPNFYLQRINPCGLHDPDKYYYVWLIGGEENISTRNQEEP